MTLINKEELMGLVYERSMAIIKEDEGYNCAAQIAETIIKSILEAPPVEVIPIEWLENFRDGLDTLSENRLMHAIDLIINAYRAEKKRKEE